MPKQKRSYKKVECSICKKMVGNLKNHILLAHPTEAEQREDTRTQELTKETLLTTPPKPPASPEKTTYACSDCHAEVRKGEANCWNCQAELNWGGY